MKQKIPSPILYVLLFIFLSHQVALAAEFRFSPRQNKAHLIEWRPWNKETLESARNEGKLIILSLSAVWCHWCHVMDETTYSDMDIIDFINKKLIPIRVDSDMRPDIDSLFNQGGWPSTVLLTPEGEIFDGGTYIPPKEMMLRLSQAVETFHRQKTAIQDSLKRRKTQKESDQRVPLKLPDSHDIAKVKQLVTSFYDSKYGGFGTWQKFPNPEIIEFLLSEYVKKGDLNAQTMIQTTLNTMSRGEIYDKVEGGFFRYSTKPDWSEPHYEKMLDVNAGQLRNYSHAYMVFQDTSHKKIIKETVRYTTASLFDKTNNAFYGSQDADEHYYTKKRRKNLTPPHVDRTIYADSNSQMISALISAYAALNDKASLTLAQKAADFIIQNLYTEKEGIYHYFRNGERHLSGLLSDNVLFGMSLIDLYNVTGNRAYLDRARSIGRIIIDAFYDDTERRFNPTRNTTVITPVTTSRMFDFKTAQLNYRTLILLSKLYLLEKDERNLGRILNDAFSALRSSYERFPPIASIYGIALKWHMENPIEFTIVADNNTSKDFLSIIKGLYIPEKTVKVLFSSTDKEIIKKSGYSKRNAVYICIGKTCLPPITQPEMIREEVTKLFSKRVKHE